MRGNTTNHPPRKGVIIKPSKDGRTKRRTFALTPEADRRLQEIVKAQGVSFNDWLHRKITE